MKNFWNLIEIVHLIQLCHSLILLEFSYSQLMTTHILWHQLLKTWQKHICVESRILNFSCINVWKIFFRDYVNKFKSTNESFEDLIKDDEFFRSKLTQYLFSPRGAIYQVWKSSKFDRNKKIFDNFSHISGSPLLLSAASLLLMYFCRQFPTHISGTLCSNGVTFVKNIFFLSLSAKTK